MIVQRRFSRGGAEEVLRCRGVQVLSCRVAELQKCRSAEVQRCTGVQVYNAQVMRCTCDDVQGWWCRDAEVLSMC